MDILTGLTRDHRLLRKLFAEFSEIDRRDSVARRTTLNEIEAVLSEHSVIEVHTLFGALQEAAPDDLDLRERILASVKRHAELRLAFDEAMLVNESDAEYHATWTEFSEDLERHMSIEEQQIFALARRRFDEVELDELASRALRERVHAPLP